MTRLVVDASAALHIVRRTQLASPLARWVEEAETTYSPRLFVSEVANALWKYVRAGAFGVESASILHGQAIRFIDSWGDDAALAEEALRAAVADDHPVYDMTYAVLARHQQAYLLTADLRSRRRLARTGIPVAPTDEILQLRQ
ncbi:MAG: type II toxin-antitoxin system VapC family toxin [Holophagales bacterium]|nr:type II toxin-antitoxin system VapC family toxin [Holophagales bacterium]